MLWRLITCLFIVCYLGSPTIAYAATSPPDSTPTIDDVHIYRHLLEPNDFLLIAKYNIPYAAIPDATVEQAYLFRLIDTDNTTVLLSNEAYPYPTTTKGYGYGLISLYASDADAPTWGQNYSVQITGKPSEFADSENVTWNYPISSSAYSTFATQAANQVDLADKIIEIAQDLELAWSITLLDTGDTGIILSTNGELYFRNSIPGLQLMAPSLFELQIEDPDYTTENWTTAQADTYRTRLTGTWIGNAFQSVATLLGMDFHFIASIPLFLGSIFCMVVGGRENNIFSGLLGVVALAIYGALMGLTPFIVLSIGTVAIAAFMGYQWFLKSTG